MDWRYTGNQPKLGPLDASAALPLLLLVIWPAKGHWTFDVLMYLTIGMVIGLAIVSRRGYAPIPALRLLRAKIGQRLGGGGRPTRMTYEKHKVRKTR